jgi:hypothetical protein
VRHASSGRYYARAFANGKEVWKSLRTAHFSVTKARLGHFLKDFRENLPSPAVDASARMTFGEALKIHQKAMADDVQLKPRTRDYWREIFVALLKSWPSLADRNKVDQRC